MAELSVTFRVTKPVQVDDVLLPPGDYPGVRRQNLVPGPAGKSTWTAPEYLLTLTAEQMASMGAQHTAQTMGQPYDVSDQVRTGNIEVTEA